MAVHTRKLSIVLGLLLLAGLLRLPLEKPVANDLRANGLMPEPLDLKTSEALGQTFAAVSLGGLRSLVAAMLNYNEVGPAWSDQDWLAVFNSFEKIHALQPKVRYYWESAATYAADDAYADYGDRRGLPESRRKVLRNEVFQKGLFYLESGRRNLPDDPRLPMMQARILSDPYKPEHLDYRKATGILDEAVRLPDAYDSLKRQRLYLMSRVPERRAEALREIRQLYDEDPYQRFPSINSLLFALQNEIQPDHPDNLTAEEIFGSSARQLRSLFNHYQRRDEDVPVAGVRGKLESLLREMNPPSEVNPLINNDIKRVTLKLQRFLEICPLELPMENPAGGQSGWPEIVAHFEEYGSESLPTVRALIFVLQELNPPTDRMPPSLIFPSRADAFRDLYNYYLDRNKGYPMDGVRPMLEQLVSDLELPEELNPFRHTNMGRLGLSWLEDYATHRAEVRGLIFP